MLLATSGCANNGGFLRQQSEAAARQGAAEARNDVPPLARVCWRETPHAVPRQGEELLTLLAREGAQLDQANRDKRDCRAIETRWREGLGN